MANPNVSVVERFVELAADHSHRFNKWETTFSETIQDLVSCFGSAMAVDAMSAKQLNTCIDMLEKYE